MRDTETRLYGDLKRYATGKLDCASQVILRRKLSSSQKSSQACALKIVLQMNAKMGQSLWIVPNYSEYWNVAGRRVALAGIASSLGRGGLMIGFVGTLNKELSQVFSDYRRIKSR